MNEKVKLKKAYFKQKLLVWSTKHNTRDLPWKNISNPYHIWVSEIMLQQTQAETVIPYYKRFIKKYPSLSSLAKANNKEVFHLWQGLGFYRRCENLIQACQFLHKQKMKTLPADYIFIKNLKGIGNYTAAAICSFAFNMPYAVVDANVYRILSRYFGLKNAKQKEIEKLAQEIAPIKKIKAYNQGIMDFGSQICKPKNPLCTSCCMQKHCSAFSMPKHFIRQSKTQALEKKIVYWYFFLVYTKKNNLYLEQRKNAGIWKNLFTPLYVESLKPLSEKQSLSALCQKYTLDQKDLRIKKRGTPFSQTLSHRKVIATYYLAHYSKRIQDMVLVNKEQVKAYPYPKVLIDIFKEEGIIKS